MRYIQSVRPLFIEGLLRPSLEARQRGALLTRRKGRVLEPSVRRPLTTLTISAEQNRHPFNPLVYPRAGLYKPGVLRPLLLLLVPCLYHSTLASASTMSPIISEILKIQVAPTFQLDSPAFKELRDAVVVKGGVKEQYYGMSMDHPDNLLWVIREHNFCYIW